MIKRYLLVNVYGFFSKNPDLILTQNVEFSLLWLFQTSYETHPFLDSGWREPTQFQIQMASTNAGVYPRRTGYAITIKPK